MIEELRGLKLSVEFVFYIYFATNDRVCGLMFDYY